MPRLVSLPNARRVLSTAALALTITAPGLASAAPPEEAAATTRREQWERLRRQKLDALRPPQTDFLERAALAVEKAERPNLQEWNVGGFYPRAQTIGWGSQLALGTRFWQPDLAGSRFDVHGAAFYSIRRYEAYHLQAGFLPHHGRALPARAVPGDDPVDFADELHRGADRWLGYFSLAYHHLPEVDFWGLGNDTGARDRSTFLLQDAWYDLAVAYRPAARAMMTVRGGLMQASVGPGRDDDVPSLEQSFPGTPGLAGQPDFVHLTGAALLDGRDEPGNPHKGAMLGLAAARYDDRGGGDRYRFHRLSADARGFVPLGSPQRVVALRAFASVDRAADGAAVPFYLQQTLGGSHTLRGFPSFRFRGERLLLLQAEYRWEAAPAIELAVFVDAGRVSPRGEGWSLQELHTSWGGGLRVKTFDAVRLRMDVARSRETTRFMVRLGPSF